jgi:hypothetical protein
MRLDRALLLLTVSHLGACTAAEREEPAKRPLPLALAIVEDEPALLLSPDSGHVVVSDITYDDFGRLRSYAFEYVRTPSDTLRGLVIDADSGSAPEARRFEARIGADTLSPVLPGVSPLPVAVVPKEPGGLRLKGADSVVTDLGYDSFGRQQVAAQEFTIGSQRWKAVFSDYQRDDAGRFVRFALRLERKQ